MVWYKYKYYDTPDGQDVFKKVFVTSKYAAIAGVGFATYDVLMFSHPKGLFNTANRYCFYLGPLVGMATAFTVTANAAQNFRGKDDNINYFLGGAVAGSIVGAWTRSAVVGVPAALILGAVAIVKKEGIDNGWTFFPDVAQSTKSIRSVRHDWTLVKDIEELKSWTTGRCQKIDWVEKWVKKWEISYTVININGKYHFRVKYQVPGTLPVVNIKLIGGRIGSKKGGVSTKEYARVICKVYCSQHS